MVRISVGQRIPRIDAYDKVTGNAQFVSDISLPSMLTAKLLRSPLSHAYVRSIDVSAAQRVPGVEMVITHKDVPHKYYAGGGSVVPSIRDMLILDEKVRFVGDGVAAIAARNEDAAEEALRLIKVDYEELPAVFDVEQAIQDGAPHLHSAPNNIARYVPVRIGNIEEGLAQADVVVSGRYLTSRVQHCPMETHVCVADWCPGDQLDVWSSTQSPFCFRLKLADALDIPLGRINVMHTGHIGGAFGGKLDLYQREPLCAYLSKLSGKPVRLSYTREEEFVCSVTRHPTIIDIELGAKRDGTLTALKARVMADTGAYASDGPFVVGVIAGVLGALYRCPNVWVDAYCVYTNNPIAAAFRGYGNPQAMHTLESHMDVLAGELGMDPIELRLKNMIRLGDNNPLAPGTRIESCDLEQCIRLGVEHSDWYRKRSGQGYSTQSGKKRGLGMACMIHNSGTGGTGRKPEHSAAFIKMNEDGSFNLAVGASDMGQGICTALTQIAAEELGVEPSWILLDPFVSTATSPFDMGSYASRDVYVIGNVVKAAAYKLKQEILSKAAQILDTPIESLIVENGTASTKDGSKAITFATIAQFLENSPTAGGTFLATASFEPIGNAPSFAAQFAEVEVDTETGNIEVIKLWAIHDVGKAINPDLVEGQIEGSLQQGLGYALSEQMIMDASGRVLNPNFTDYKVFTAQDMPPLKVFLVESDEPSGPFGAKGVGEPGLVPTAPAIANAVANAIGIRITKIPILPEDVLSALATLTESAGFVKSPL